MGIKLGLENAASDMISESVYRQQEFMDLVNLKTRYDETVDSFDPNYIVNMAPADIVLAYLLESVSGVKKLMSSADVWNATTQEELFKIMFSNSAKTYYMKDNKIGVIGTSGTSALQASGYAEKGKVATMFVAAKNSVLAEMDGRELMKKDAELTAKNKLVRNTIVWMINNCVGARRLFTRNILHLTNHASGKISSESLELTGKEYHMLPTGHVTPLQAATETLQTILNYLNTHQENAAAVIDFLKQDPGFESLLVTSSTNKLVNELQDIVSKYE